MSALKAIRRTAGALVVTATVAALLVVGGRPAAAGDEGPLSDSFHMSQAQVSGSYLPIPLRLACNQGRAAIFWYGKGSAPDSLWTEIISQPDGTLDYTVRKVSVRGVYKPFSGDFDGNGCTDIFWYAPGPEPDYVWWYGANLAVTSTRVNVNGTYTPLVGSWDDSADYASDIFWYAPGATRESIWTGKTSKSFVARGAPQVAGTYRPAVYGDESILWHAPGTAQDRWWSQVAYTRSTPVSQQAITVNESYQAYSVLGRPFLYQPGPGLDRAVFGYSGSSLTTTVGNVPGGPHVVGASAESALIVFHAPGPETDHIWSRG